VWIGVNAMERTSTNAILKIQKNYNILGFMLDPFSRFAWKGLKILNFKFHKFILHEGGVTSHP